MSEKYVRNNEAAPETVFIKLKMLAEIDRRRLNNELLVAIEAGVRELEGKLARRETSR